VGSGAEVIGFRLVSWYSKMCTTMKASTSTAEDVPNFYRAVLKKND